MIVVGGTVSDSVAHAAAAFGDELEGRVQRGELIRGRVLVRYDDQRYLLDFGGDRRVVESAIPLAVEDVLYGKVVVVGERIEIRRVRIEPARRRGGAAVGHNTAAAQPSAVHSGMTGARVSRVRRDARPSAAARPAAPQIDPRDAANAMLARLALERSPQNLRAAADTLRKPPREPAFGVASAPIELGIGPAPETPSKPPADALLWVAGVAMLLQASIGAFLRHAHFAPTRSLPAIVFNVQSASAVAHTAVTLPFAVDGRSFEVDLALFEQQAQSAADRSALHRSVVLSVNLAALGHVEVRVVAVDRHVSVRFVCAQEKASRELARYAALLRGAFVKAEWSLDALQYEAAESAGSQPVVRAVFEHVTKGWHFSLLD